jgi:uncharacterized protein (DUF58 family)
LDPKVLARITQLEIRAKEIVEGLISGGHRSPFLGQSIEFAQHREYAPGDDLRRIDWKVWGRSDRYYLKQYEEETNLRATLLVDVSRSMDYGEGPQCKRWYASSLAAVLSYLLLRQSDAVGLSTFDSDLRAEIPQRAQQKHLRAILHGLETASPGEKTDLEKVLTAVLDRQPRRGMIVLISDLLADRQSVLRGLSAMRRRRFDVVVLHVMHDDELDFLFEGSTRFEGLEDAQTLLCEPRALRDAYLAALGEFLAEVRRGCAGMGIDYRLARTSESIGAVVSELLHHRSLGN